MISCVSLLSPCLILHSASVPASMPQSGLVSVSSRGTLAVLVESAPEVV